MDSGQLASMIIRLPLRTLEEVVGLEFSWGWEDRAWLLFLLIKTKEKRHKNKQGIVMLILWGGQAPWFEPCLCH